ncbi:MAG: LicD family protein [Ruminococcus sp.]|uniref:LicD family protein n=1 Tax=Ruminococcus sp. TaxID=41978 RepID=UPI002872D793|nr:LicD family protein [Ruminococcus sp.]MBQ3284143.1 LicD family protein [Ruminococcus sp.]
MSEVINIDRETLRKLQLKELESLVYFDNFCKEHDLTYFLLGGCVIGAVRHNGFIPWDDDIDVMMPRRDYERMLKLWKQEESNERFLMLKTDGEVFTGNCFATLIDTSATMVKENQKNIDVPHGIVTDVFPLDGCPDGRLQRYMQYYHAMMYSLYISEVVPSKHGGLIKIVSSILLKLVPSRERRTKIWKKHEKKMTRYAFNTHKKCTELCAGPGYMRNEYPQIAFKEIVYHEFEGLQMPIPKGYDAYLKMAFGDYMQLPPEDQRVPHHDLVALDLEKPCNQPSP